MKIIIGRKKRVVLRLLRKAAQKVQHATKGIRATIILKDNHEVNILKSRIIRGKLRDHSIKFNR